MEISVGHSLPGVGHALPGESVAPWNRALGRSSPPPPPASIPHGADFAQAQRIVIRLIDIAAACAGLILFAPLLVLIACLVRIDGSGPSLFAHERIGRFGVPFPCLKFRTMVVDADLRLIEHLRESSEARAEWARDFKLRRDPRITSLGRFLRRSSLDELPQLVNILIGHMSLVGPRPIVEEEVRQYGVHFADYCSVRPGLTGLWQVSGRNNLSYAERISLDRQYVRTKTISGDLLIVLRTVPAMLFPVGSY